MAQSFRSPRANLSAIDVELGSYGGLPANGRVRLVAGDGPDGTPVYDAPLTSASWARNPFLTINFPPIATSEGATYTLVIETPRRPLATALGIKYSSFDVLSSGSMYLNNQPQPGDQPHARAQAHGGDLGLESFVLRDYL